MEDFFELESIQNKSIKSITIYKSDKKDDEIFCAERKFAEYFFSTDGKLYESRKFVPLSRRIDTSVFEFLYDGSKLISRTENQGPFSFKYSYSWLNDSAFQEIKIDENTSDTNYVHRVEIQGEEELKRKYSYYNSIGRPMKSEWITTNFMAKVISKKESYSRSLSFVVDSFNYKATQLIHRMKWNTIGVHKRTHWEYSYQGGYLDFIREMEERVVVAKLAMLYDDNKLIKSIVKRDVKEKTISVYKVEYDYYSTEK
ncbi:MAG: hypothetical protein ACJAV5_001609 [Vicingaceae bacterium]|jgi:hypothetical protein